MCDQEKLYSPITNQMNHQTPKRVLVVEDDDVNRWLASRLLEQKGYLVSTVTNGQAALAAIEQDSFDLILMDIQMPLMDGLATTTAIRHQEQQTGKHIPIIAFTPETAAEETKRYWNAGMDSYLTKPIHTEDFYRTIEAVFALNARLAEVTELPPTFDYEQALDRLSSDVEILRHVAERFFNTAPHLIAAMRRAIAKDDPYNLDFAAHRLRGTASNLSAHAIVELAQRLELIGSVRNMSQAEATLATLEEEFERLKAAYNEAMPLLKAQKGAENTE